jgi:hypothetical protein
MTKIFEKKTNTNDLKLQEDLERRFGEAMAQEIMDQIKKADNINKGLNTIPDYCGVKALSEGAEIYRREAQIALKRLKTWKRNRDEAKLGVVDWDGALLKSQFERSFSYYLRFNRSFHILYRQAMEAYKVAGTYPYKEVRTNQTEQTTMSQAA